MHTEDSLPSGLNRGIMDADDYRTEIVTRLQEAWELARNSIKKAPARQKKQYDHTACPEEFKVEDRVIVYMPAAKPGPAYKLARPYHGPYRVVTTQYWARSDTY